MDWDPTKPGVITTSDDDKSDAFKVSPVSNTFNKKSRGPVALPYSSGWENRENPYQGINIQELFSDLGEFLKLFFNAIVGGVGYDIQSRAMFGPSEAEKRGLDNDGNIFSSPFDALADSDNPEYNQTPGEFANNNILVNQNQAFQGMMNFVFHLEKDTIVNEPDGYYSRYGINTRYHFGVKKEDVGEAEYERQAKAWLNKLTMGEAREIYQKKYFEKINWEHIGGMANVPLSVQLVALDTAVHCGPPQANKMLKEAYKEIGNDYNTLAEKVIELREDYYADLIKNNPAKYGGYEDGWEDRIKQLREKVEELKAYRTAYAFQPTNNTELRLYNPTGNKFPVSDTFRFREIHPTNGTPAMHRGTDIATPIGTELVAQAQGQVVYAGWSEGYGNIVVIHYGNGVYGMDAHLKNDNVKTGDIIEAGEVYAYTGNTGGNYSPHLHTEIWIQRNGHAYVVDPQMVWGKDLFDHETQEFALKDADQKTPESYKLASAAYDVCVKPTGLAYNPESENSNETLVASNPQKTTPVF